MTTTSSPATVVRPLRSGRALVAGLLALGCLALAACGDGAAPSNATAPPVAVDQGLHDTLPASVLASGTVRVLTDASYAPMSSFAADGRTIVGMEPDLAKALGRVLGVRFAFTTVDFTDIPKLLRTGRADIGLSAITDTKERHP